VDKKTLLFEQVEKAGRSTFSQAWGSWNVVFCSFLPPYVIRFRRSQ
jgi:hypothetical protein